MTGFTLTLAHASSRQPEPDAILDAHDTETLVLLWQYDRPEALRRADINRTASRKNVDIDTRMK